MPAPAPDPYTAGLRVLARLIAEAIEGQGAQAPAESTEDLVDELRRPKPKQRPTPKPS